MMEIDINLQIYDESLAELAEKHAKACSISFFPRETICYGEIFRKISG